MSGPSAYPFPERDRFYDEDPQASEGRRSFAAVLFAVSVFCLVVSLSCRQATAPAPARNMIEAGLVTLTDIDQLIADNGTSLRELAEASEEPAVQVPGYPLTIVLSRDEVLESSDAELRQLILNRSSGLIYTQGLAAFDRTGKQSVRRASVQGLLEMGVAQVSRETYDRSTFLALLSLGGAVVFGAVTGGAAQGFGRMRAIGIAVALGAAPAALLSLAARLLVGAVGGDDPFISGLRDIARAALMAPLRNAAIMVAAGLVVTAAAIVLGQLERRTSPALPAEHDW